ncbi:Sec-independent protein translocase subunit TatA [Mycobacterium botniense]|uniref:Sec-independent protein translocase protein TatA n=1 Tax=Mycobacterium botniense TaxID=84962 RepID=A0A7I9Y1Q6_9MYCO|nr:Sec-independent protein translocase subunit TatA [Mycobacterium botniense]GFG76006.1 Sec-independent protein translocase protein TatA [Mycobacterium botniense]
MGSLSPWHWAILAAVVIVLFGAKRLPDAARALGKSLRIFKAEVRELQNETKADTPAAAHPAQPHQVQSERVDPPMTPGPGDSDARSA